MRLSVFFFLLASLGAAVAWADEAVLIPFSLDYVAAVGCPGSDAFEAALRARQPSASRVPESDRVTQIHVRLAAAENESRSEIWANLPDGTSFRRQVPEASCTEAMASMAIIAAMALEGNHSSTSTLEPAAPAEIAAPDATMVSTPTPSSSAVSPLARPSVAAPSMPPSSGAAPRTRWHWSAFAAGGVEGGVASSLAPAFAAGVEVAQHGASLLAPALRLSGVFAEQGSDSVAGSDVHLRLLTGRFELCPKEVTRGRWLATACVVADAGELHGSANRVDNKQDQAMFWLGAGLGARAAFALASAVAIDVGASGRVLAVHDRFIIRPTEIVYQVPRIAGDFLVGLRFSWR